MGSAAIEAYTVASGRVDAFVTLNISPWDIAAGAVCVLEAGGLVTDFDGNLWTLGKSDVCMSNGRLHDSILSKLEVVNPSHPEYSVTTLAR
jgi:myo-inositol-1(or 4)-monophosphatase